MAANDQSPLALPVKIVDPTTSSYQATVTQAGALLVSAAAGGGFGTGAIDNIVGPTGPGTAASSAGVVAGIYNNSVLAPTSGQMVALQLNGVAALKVAIISSSGTELNYSNPVAVTTGFVSTAALTKAAISSATMLGATILVPSSSGQTTRVHRIYFTVGTGTQVSFLNGSTALTGQMLLNAGGGIFMDLSSEPWFITGTNQSFGISTTSTSAVNGRVEYLTSA